jgi:hypothetical protein
MMRTASVILFLTCWTTFSGELSDYYFKHTTNRLDSPKIIPLRVATNHSISEIGIERTVCLGGCPAYTFIAKGDGTFRYRGEKHVQRTGEYTGTISVPQFHKLAQFILDSGYLELEDAYSGMITDQPTVYTSVVLSAVSGKRKVISNYANTGPTKLWAIEQLIDQLMTTAKWKELKAGLPEPPEPLLPKVTRYDTNSALRAAYLQSFRVGYSNAWERKEELPVTQPTTDVDKARIFGYGDGMLAGRTALATWFGTNSPSLHR